MESQIEVLLEKYWAGETTVEEEQKIKAWYRENPALTPESTYFRTLSGKQKVASGKRFAHPAKARRNTHWLAAAVVIVAITAGTLVFQDAKKQREYVVEDPQEAYEITKKALLMVSSGLNEGRTYSEELTRINKAEEIINN